MSAAKVRILWVSENPMLATGFARVTREVVSRLAKHPGIERIDEMIRSKQALADEVLGEDGGHLLTEMSNAELLRFVSLDIHRAASALDG